MQTSIDYTVFGTQRVAEKTTSGYVHCCGNFRVQRPFQSTNGAGYVDFYCCRNIVRSISSISIGMVQVALAVTAEQSENHQVVSATRARNLK